MIKFINANMNWLYGLLRFSFLISIIAIPLSFLGFLDALYFVDLFSHFTLQYMIGAFIFSFYFLICKQWRKCFFSVVICILCFIETRWHLHEPLRFYPENKRPAIYKVVTYNHYIYKSNFDEFTNWVRSNDFDAVILQEANLKTVEISETLLDIYPHQVIEPRKHPFGMVILSRYPFIEVEKILLDGHSYQSFAVRLKIKNEKAQYPLNIYALHPPPPSGPARSLQRSYELLTVADYVANDTSRNILMLGDFNLTAFAPSFGKVLKKSGLHYQSYGLLLNPSWPSFSFFDFLKIPIDHVFYSDSLIQIKKEIGPSMGSDHHPLVVSYAEKENK